MSDLPLASLASPHAARAKAEHVADEGGGVLERARRPWRVLPIPGCPFPFPRPHRFPP